MVWLAISCPSAMMRRINAGCLRAAFPTMKNVALASCFLRMSRTSGVNRGSGPSSIVRITFLPVIPVKR